MNPELAAILARVAQREGVPPALLLGAVASMGAAGKPDFSRIEHDLLRKAGDFKALRGRLLKPSGSDAELDRLRAEAARLLAEGRLAEAIAAPPRCCSSIRKPIAMPPSASPKRR